MQSTDTPREGVTRLRVRYCECDPMGLAHHGSYAAWFEIGRTELFRLSGITYKDLEKQGLFLAIVKLEIRFKKPAFYDDLLEIRTSLLGSSRVKLTHHYEIWRDDEFLTSANTTLAAIDRHGRPQPLPDWLMRIPEDSSA